MTAHQHQLEQFVGQSFSIRSYTGRHAFIGAKPRTEWLGDAVMRDEHGFILTGPDVAAVATDQPGSWSLERTPFLLETSTPGVFAAGDVRRSSMKRVASAVGEGSSAISNVHLYLDTV